MVYLVNRSTGQYLEMGHSTPSGKWDFPKAETLESSGFAKIGQAIEMVSITPSTERYYGLEYRKDLFKVLDRGMMTESGVLKLTF